MSDSQPIDPTLLEIFCRFCSENEAEAVTQEELDRLLDEGFTNVSHVTPMGAAYLVRALRLSELRVKWLEECVKLAEAEEAIELAYSVSLANGDKRGHELAVKAFISQQGRRDEARQAYEKAGGVV